MRIKPAPEWSGGGVLAARAALAGPGTASLGSSSPDPSGAPLFCRSRRRRMSTQILDALSRLAARRFGSFADAATDVLDLLESACPGGSLALGQVDWDEGTCRMIDARGDGDPARLGDPALARRARHRLGRRRSARRRVARGARTGQLGRRAARRRGRPRDRRAARHRRGRRRPAARGRPAAARSALGCSRTSGRASRRARSCGGSPRWRATAPAPIPSRDCPIARRSSPPSSANGS